MYLRREYLAAGPLVAPPRATLAHRGAGDVITVYKYIAVSWAIQASHDTQHGGLAGKCAAKYHIAGTGFKFKADIFEMDFLVNNLVNVL
jgi:hypothetical protein